MRAILIGPILLLIAAVFVSCPKKDPPTAKGASAKQVADAGVVGYAWKSKKAQTHFDKAQQFLKQGKEAKAALELRHAVVEEPGAAQPREALCRLLAGGREVERALDSCRAAVRVLPASTEMRYLTARLQLRKRAFKEAREALAPALKTPTKDRALQGRVAALMGVLELQLGQVKQAIGQLQQATQIDPSSRSAFRNLAIALAQGGRCDEARAARDKARALKDPGRAIDAALRHYCELMLRAEAAGKPFLIDKRPVSGGEYSSCVDVRVCPKVPYDEFNRKGKARQEPAMSINWEAARAYCTKLNKRLPTVAEYQAARSKLQWQPCCVRGVMPREWTSDAGKKPQTGVQVRKGKKGLELLETKRSRGVDSSTVRCAKDI